jgi:hypothetical protein
MLGFQALAKRGIKLLAWPDLKEIGSGPSSTGVSLQNMSFLQSFIKMDEDALKLDLRFVEEGWKAPREDSLDAREDRAEVMRKGLWELGQGWFAFYMMVSISHNSTPESRSSWSVATPFHLFHPIILRN